MLYNLYNTFIYTLSAIIAVPGLLFIIFLLTGWPDLPRFILWIRKKLGLKNHIKEDNDMHCEYCDSTVRPINIIGEVDKKRKPTGNITVMCHSCEHSGVPFTFYPGPHPKALVEKLRRLGYRDFTPTQTGDDTKDLYMTTAGVDYLVCSLEEAIELSDEKLEKLIAEKMGMTYEESIAVQTKYHESLKAQE